MNFFFSRGCISLSFFLIKGTFHVKGYSIDPDSCRFKAKDPNNWKLLTGPEVEKPEKPVQLRLEAIDGLETHYSGHHQPLELGRFATDFLISQLGITDVEWNSKHSEVIEANDGTEGYILTRVTDRYHRPVAFAFAGTIDEDDGKEIFLDTVEIKKSVNYKSIAEGHSYPTYYHGLFFDFREEFTKAVKKARKNKKGVWKLDKTNAGFQVKTLEDITENHLIMPKLFRRILEHIEHGGKIDNFIEFLKIKCDFLVTLPNTNFTRLDAIIEIKDNTITLKEKPEDLIFVSTAEFRCKKPG